MENYTITKEQILELASWWDKHHLEKVKEWFPDAFKKELEVGRWYKSTDDTKIEFLVCYQGNGDYNYGFWEDLPYRNNMSFGDCWHDVSVLATDEEVEEALENEVIKRFGKDWKNAKIEKCLIHSGTHSGFEPVVTTDEIWNENGCIYRNGVFAEPLKSKVISLEKAERILSKKYGQKVEIK